MTQYPAEFVISVWGITATACMFLAWFLAGIKNRDIQFWMAWSFLVPPLVLALFLMPTLSGPRPRRPQHNDSIL